MLYYDRIDISKRIHPTKSNRSMDIYKSVKISIGTVMKNPEMLKFLH